MTDIQDFIFAVLYIKDITGEIADLEVLIEDFIANSLMLLFIRLWVIGSLSVRFNSHCTPLTRSGDSTLSKELCLLR